MPGRRNPRAKWVLPAVVNPPERLCYKVFVPNERQHIGAFLGAIYALSSAMSWQDDTAHTAKQVAIVWQGIFDDLRTENCNEPEVLHAIAEMEYTLSICEQLRFNDKGKLQGLCCGVWTDIDGQQQGVGQPGQPGDDQPQPDAGGCQTYHAAFSATSQWLLPTVVNDGDTLDFTGQYGSGFDGNVTETWDCWDGKVFFAGACIGTPLAIGSPDPAPLLPHMALVAHIASVWYLCDNNTLTVPSGVSNEPVVIQVNDSILADNSGGYSMDIKVCNNKPVDWTHTINLATSQPLTIFYNPSYSVDPTGEWVAGDGYKTKSITTVSSGNHYTYLEAYQQFSAATTLTSIQLVFDEAPGSNTAAGNLGNYILWRDAGGAGTILLSVGLATGTGILFTWIGSQAAHGLGVQLWTGDNNPGDGDPGGHARLYQMTVSGRGFDPYA